jgi:hypothetical protein
MNGRKADEKLSRDPAQIRRRLRRKHAKFDTDFQMYVESGAIKPLDEWDLEELAHGYPRNKNGRFSGVVPKWAYGPVRAECRKRLKTKALDMVAEQLNHAIRVLVDLLDDEDSRIRLQAATLIMEYCVGKPTAKVEMEGSPALQAMLAHALVLPSGQPDYNPVIEGEVVDEEDDDD